MDEKQLKQITERLDKLTRIIALSATQNMTTTEKIVLFAKSGFRPIEIADVIGTTVNTVNVMLSKMRKRKVEGQYG